MVARQVGVGLELRLGVRIGPIERLRVALKHLGPRGQHLGELGRQDSVCRESLSAGGLVFERHSDSPIVPSDGDLMMACSQMARQGSCRIKVLHRCPELGSGGYIELHATPRLQCDPQESAVEKNTVAVQFGASTIWLLRSSAAMLVSTYASSAARCVSRHSHSISQRVACWLASRRSGACAARP